MDELLGVAFSSFLFLLLFFFASFSCDRFVSSGTVNLQCETREGKGGKGEKERRGEVRCEVNEATNSVQCDTYVVWGREELKKIKKDMNIKV